MKRIVIAVILLLLTYNSNAQKALECWMAGNAVTLAEIEQFGVDNCFAVCQIDDITFARMKGKSYKAECTIPRSELRYIKALHVTQDGAILMGEMVVNRAIAQDVVAILRRLYEAGYPIEKMVLVDEYNADDELSMRANNSSAFNYRHTPGGTRLSAHSRGMAVDINPLYNPYVKNYPDRVYVAPATATEYVNRHGAFPYKIDRDDLCCRLFLERGFEWGGDYKTIKDYQHFEK